MTVKVVILSALHHQIIDYKYGFFGGQAVGTTMCPTWATMVITKLAATTGTSHTCYIMMGHPANGNMGGYGCGNVVYDGRGGVYSRQFST